jgi:hypothetical protein
MDERTRHPFSSPAGCCDAWFAWWTRLETGGSLYSHEIAEKPAGRGAPAEPKASCTFLQFIQQWLPFNGSRRPEPDVKLEKPVNGRLQIARAL